jgi:hypothetical protein
VIRALRRWLLGAEPEGPPLLADPLYRWEVRRYWTWRQYIIALVVMSVWWGVTGICALSLSTGSAEEMVLVSACASFLGRLPLSLMVVIGGALAVASDRFSGELEQLVLTPLDPARVMWGRYWARMSGIMLLWALASVVPIVIWPAGLSTGHLARSGELGTSTGFWISLALLMAVMHLDWGVMLLADGAEGLSSSTTARSRPGALFDALLGSFMATPIMLGFAALLGALAGGLVGALLGWEGAWLPWAVGALLLRLTVGVLMIRAELSRAHRGCERLFLEPEDPA